MYLPTFDRPTLVTITAPTCSGKNYLRDRLEKQFGFSRIISTTTRAKRANEVEGSDYYFIDTETSIDFETDGAFAELVELRGVRYGVTHAEMNKKMTASETPVVILEPAGLAMYKKLCTKHGWDIFSIYVHISEELALERLVERTTVDLIHRIDTFVGSINQNYAQISRASISKLVSTHTDRVLMITGEERRWSNSNLWDAVVPGDDVDKALELIRVGIKHRNSRRAMPTPMTYTPSGYIDYI